MTTIEDQVWEAVVAGLLPKAVTDSLTKKDQQALADALQEWAAKCIWQRLYDVLDAEGRDDVKRYLAGKEEWAIHHKGKAFLGAIRWQEVDDWLSNPEAGLVLAVDPKHFQSQGSLRKNWKNGLNDLVAFATNLHERFPLCGVAGVISFPEWAATAADLKPMHSICLRVIPRQNVSDPYGKFEAFALAVYDSQSRLTWPFKQDDSPIMPGAAFSSMARTIYSRTLGLLPPPRG